MEQDILTGLTKNFISLRIRLEADNSMLRMQIHVVGNLLEPRSSEDLSGLFGVVGKRGFDGIHLRGYCGADSLFDSLVKIISNM